MAKKVAVEALLKLRDEISQNSKRVDKALGKLDKTTRKTKGSVKALGASLAKVGLGLGIASIALKKVLAAQSLQIKSINSLNLALANQGNLLPGTSQRLQEYASELQGITTFGDEVILQNQALLASFGMNENQLKTTTKAALDFAAATGSDLKAAVNLLGKAFVGETGSLSRYGIVIDSSLSKTAKFDAVIQQLTMRFGGAAQAETKTFTGQMEQLGNQFGDTSESIGKFIGFLGTFGGSIQSTVAMLKRVGTFFSEDLVLAVGVARKALLDFGALYVDVVSNISKVGNELFNASSSGGAFSISFEAAQQAAIEAGQTIPTLQEFTAQWEAAGMATSETKTFLDDLAASLRFQGEELASQAALAASAAGATIDYSAAQEAAAAGADSHAFALGGLTTAAAAFKNAGLPQEIDSVTDANRRAADAADMHAVLLGIASKRAEELGIVGPSAIQPITLASVDATAAMGSFGGVIGEAQGLLGLMGVEADSAFGKILGWADKVMSAFDGLLGLLGKLGGGFGSLFEGGGGGFSLGGLFGGGGAGGAAAGGAAGGLGGLGGAIAGLATNPFTIGIAGLTAAIFGLSKLFGKGATAGQEFDESGRRFGAVGGAVTEGTRAHIENLRSQTGGSIQGAFSLGLGAIIKDALSAGFTDMEFLLERTGDIFSSLERGEINRDQTTAALKDAVGELLAGTGGIGGLGPEVLDEVQRIVSAADTHDIAFEGLGALKKFEQQTGEPGEEVTPTNQTINVQMDSGIITTNKNELASAIADAVGVVVKQNLGGVVGSLEKHFEGKFERVDR